MPALIAALYHFVDLDNHAALRAPLTAVCRENGVRGTLLLAVEGINGTIAGPEAGVRAVLAGTEPCANKFASTWFALFFILGGASRAPQPDKSGFPTACGLCPPPGCWVAELCWPRLD